MIRDHIGPQGSFEPYDLDRLQGAFDALKVKLSVRHEDEKAALASILIEAYQRTADAGAAQEEAGKRFAARRG